MGTIRGLQIMRAVSAIIVVFAHAIFMTDKWSPNIDILLSATEHTGRLAVYVFFVISGVIISYTAYNEFGKDGAIGRYALKRFVRVVPLYWIATLIEFSLRSILHGSPGGSALLHSLFFIPLGVDAPQTAMRPVLGVGWTLNYEFLFYVIFAGCLLFRRRLGLLTCAWAILLLVAVGMVFKSPADVREPVSLIEFWSDPILLMFLAGVGIGAYARHTQLNGPGLGGLPASFAALGAGVLIFITLVGESPAPWHWRLLFWGAAIAAVWCAVFDKRNVFGGTYVLFEKLGDASYSVYLFHFFVLVALQKLWWQVFGYDGAIAFILVASPISIAAGYLVHIWFELPLLKHLRDALTRGRSPMRETGHRSWFWQTASGLARPWMPLKLPRIGSFHVQAKRDAPAASPSTSRTSP